MSFYVYRRIKYDQIHVLVVLLISGTGNPSNGNTKVYESTRYT